jgi:4-amino-4-deoxy-L-arabinose transferase-like glycosyltransferase
LLGLLIVLLIGLGLRLVYVLNASPFVDEYSTLMAVQGILAQGVPILPAGFFYGHDVLFSYAAAGAALLFRGAGDLLAIRFLSLAASLGTAALAYAAGRRLFSRQAGLLAAALVALSPQGVLWGARARAYALEELMALLAFWLFYLGVEGERPALRRLGLLALVAAVFVHPEAALLLAGLGLAVLALHGLHWWLRLDRSMEFAVAAAGVIGRYLLQRVVAGGDVGGFETITNARPTFDLLANWGNGLQTLSSFLFAGAMIPATILALIAVLDAILRREDARRRTAVLFLALTLIGIVVQMVVVIGGTWQSVRYLLFAFPLLFLLAGAGLDALAGWSRSTAFEAVSLRLPRSATTALGAAVLVVALLPSLPGAVEAAGTEEIAFDRAFGYVSQHWAPGDRLATSAPAAAWIGQGRVDYFSLGQNYEEFVWQEDGQWHDKWVGAPLVRSAPELVSALDETQAASGASLWLVTDQSRLLTRYDADFIQTIWQRMSLVFAEGRALVFCSQPARAYAVQVNAPRRETFGDRIVLAGYAAGDLAQAGAPPAGVLVVEPGQALPLRLTWQATGWLSQSYTLFVHLTGIDGEGYAQADGLPLGGLYPMTLWQPGIRYLDPWTLTLPSDLAAGRYRLEVGFYQLESGDRLPVSEGPGRLPTEALILDYLTVAGGEAPASPAIPLDAELGGVIRLLGFSPDWMEGVVHAGDQMNLTLFWQAEAPTEEAYTLFVHVAGADGALVTQYDGQPQGGFYPTAFWDPGERLEDRVSLSVPAGAAPGPVQVLAGLYLLSSGERLPVSGADARPDGAILLGSLTLER